jgi:hypothetical protein
MAEQRIFKLENVTIYHQDASLVYHEWPTPDVIVSDGGYGVSGFKGDAREPAELKAWYLGHIQSWSRSSRPGTTLWFWNTEIGWAIVHPVLDEHGWEYVGCNIWNKGIQHIAGNCNLPVLKGFPVVTEVCVQYVRRAEFYHEGKLLSLKEWLRNEWKRTGLPMYKTNEACGVINAASRKYFTRDHLWYAPPPEIFERMVDYANKYGDPKGRPYFSFDGKRPANRDEYKRIFPTFKGRYGVTNVWNHPPLHNEERLRIRGSGKYAHLNQKPIKLIELIIEASSHPGDVIWEPFGGLCTAGLVSCLMSRKAYCAEIDEHTYKMAVSRLEDQVRKARQQSLLLEHLIQYEVT